MTQVVSEANTEERGSKVEYAVWEKKRFPAQERD